MEQGTVKQGTGFCSSVELWNRGRVFVHAAEARPRAVPMRLAENYAQYIYCTQFGSSGVLLSGLLRRATRTELKCA